MYVHTHTHTHTHVYIYIGEEGAGAHLQVHYGHGDVRELQEPGTHSQKSHRLSKVTHKLSNVSVIESFSSSIPGPCLMRNS